MRLLLFVVNKTMEAEVELTSRFSASSAVADGLGAQDATSAISLDLAPQVSRTIPLAIAPLASVPLASVAAIHSSVAAMRRWSARRDLRGGSPNASGRIWAITSRWRTSR